MRLSCLDLGKKREEGKERERGRERRKKRREGEGERERINSYERLNGKGHAIMGCGLTTVSYERSKITNTHVPTVHTLYVLRHWNKIHIKSIILFFTCPAMKR